MRIEKIIVYKNPPINDWYDWFWASGEREFDIAIHSKPIGRLAYNWQTGKIELPNKKGMKVSNSEALNLPSNEFIDDLIHEILHKWLHENVSATTCDTWDSIDKIPNHREYVYSSLGRTNY